MPNVFDVVKHILQKTGRISTMKLQKLCYYAQAWSLVWDDEELFPEEFEAWANGPVCRALFNFHKGKFAIGANDIPETLCGGSLTASQIETIDSVLEYYGDRDAQWLISLTHLESPWKNARAGVAPGMPCDACITKESMSEYYASL